MVEVELGEKREREFHGLCRFNCFAICDGNYRAARFGWQMFTYLI